MPTCQNCFDLRHIKCRGRDGCECSVCAADTKKRTKAMAKKAATKAARPEKAAPKRAAPRSDTEKAAYMREYRRRKAAGEEMGDYRRTTANDIEVMLELRRQGLTYRAIGTELGMDYSYVARIIKKAMAEGDGVEPSAT